MTIRLASRVCGSLRVIALCALTPVLLLAVAGPAQDKKEDKPAASTSAARTNADHRADSRATDVAESPAAIGGSGGGSKSQMPAGFNFRDYVISPDDVLEIDVLDVKELSRTYRVSPTGWVALPLLEHKVKAAGLTLDGFATNIEADLRTAGLVSTPHVSVAVKESRSHSVAVTGAVRKATSFPVFGRTTLLDVLSEAGGPTESAGGIVRVTRGSIGMDAGRTANNAAPESLAIDLKRLLETGDKSLNIAVFPGDTVTVAPGGVVYVVGAVNKPGGFVLSTERQDMTVLQALALAEDAKSTAKRSKAMIVRRNIGAPEGREQIPVDITKIIDGKAPDQSLRASDILFVPDSSGKKAMHRGAEAAVQMVTGLAVWGRF